MAGSSSGGKGWLGRRGRSLARIGRALRSFVPMLGDVLAGRYRPVPWRAIGCMTAAVAYLLSPLDLIPDVFLVLGLADDALIHDYHTVGHCQCFFLIVGHHDGGNTQSSLQLFDLMAKVNPDFGVQGA